MAPALNKKPFILGLNSRLFFIAFFSLLSYTLFRLLAGYSLRNYVALIPALFAVQVILNDFLETYLSTELELGHRWFSLVIAPGTILHEFSHLLAAVFSGCYVTGVSLFKFNPKRGVLGYVAYTQPRDNWFVLRSFLVSFAPFMGCGLMLVALNHFFFGESLGLDVLDVGSPQSVYENFLGLITGFFKSIFSKVLPNPLLWAVLYLQLCFALGSAPSTPDFTGFFRSLLRHPISTLFILALSYCMLLLSETGFDVFGYAPLDYLIFFFSAVILVLSYSITVLLCSIPFVYAVDKFIEVSIRQRALIVFSSIIVYYLMNELADTSYEKSMSAAVASFLLLLLVFKNRRLFLR